MTRVRDDRIKHQSNGSDECDIHLNSGGGEGGAVSMGEGDALEGNLLEY